MRDRKKTWFKLLMLSTAAAVLGGFGLTAYAASEVNISFDSTTVTVSGYSDEAANKQVMLIELCGHDISEVRPDTLEYIEQIDQTVASESGRFVFTYPAKSPDLIEDTEVHTVYITIDGAEESIVQSYEYVGTAQKEELLQQINRAGSAATLQEILSETENRCILKAMGLLTDAYQQADEEIHGSLAELVFNAKGNGYTEEELAKQFNDSLIVLLVNSSADIGGILDSYGAVIGLVQSDSEGFATLPETEKQFCVTVINARQIIDADDLRESVLIAEVLFEINDANYTVVQNLLREKAFTLQLTGTDGYERYLKLGTAGRNYVCKQLVLQAEQTPFVNEGKLEQAIADAVDAWENEQNNTGNGGGNGGGGISSGGGRGGTSSITVPVQTHEPEEEQKQDQYFSDLDDVEWAKEAITALADYGVINGVEAGRFAPLVNITREEFVKMLVEAFGLLDDSAVCGFTDVDTDAWYAPYIASANASGVVNGISDKEFGVGLAITREEMAAMSYRAAVFVGVSLAENDGTVFADQAEISGWATEAVAAMNGAEVINGMGDGRFAPQQNANRAEAAKIVYELLMRKNGGRDLL